MSFRTRQTKESNIMNMENQRTKQKDIGLYEALMVEVTGIVL